MQRVAEGLEQADRLVRHGMLSPAIGSFGADDTQGGPDFAKRVSITYWPTR